MFAFALWDCAAGACFSPATGSARSRSSTRFATARSASPPSSRRCSRTRRSRAKLDLEALDAYLALRLRAGAAQRLRRRSGSCRRRTRWSASGGEPNRALLAASTTTPQAAEARTSASSRSDPRRLLGAPCGGGWSRDVPLGAFLSGGIDSSAVVAAMAEHRREPVQHLLDRLRRTTRYDELPHARAIAERFGTDHEEFVVRARRASSVLPRSSATTASRSPTPRRSPPSTWPS